MAERLAQEVEDDDGAIRAAELTLQELASIAGLAQENMNRAAGWRFLEIGRRVERSDERESDSRAGGVIAGRGPEVGGGTLEQERKGEDQDDHTDFRSGQTVAYVGVSLCTQERC